MSAEIPAPLVTELGTERRIAIFVALSLVVVSLVFKNDRAMLLGPGKPADREASAFTAVVAPPAVSGPSYRPFTGFVASARPPRAGAPGVRTGTGVGAPAFVAPAIAPSAASAAPAGAPAAILPTEAPANAGGRTYTPQVASFIGLPGGVIFGSGNTTPTNPTDPTTPTNPTDPTTPTNPTNPTDPTTPTNPTNPTDPGTPTDPTDPTTPIDPTDPTPPITTPDPGPGAVPEPASWALMILGIGVVGASLRRRRSSPARGGLAAA